MSMTSEPESDEVTKKVTTSKVASSGGDLRPGQMFQQFEQGDGHVVADAPRPDALPPPEPCPCAMARIAEKRHPHEGEADRHQQHPTMNSRMVRPRETRAMNMPTKGDQAIHQPQ